MNINKLSGCQFLQLLGQPVFLTLQFNNFHIYGNIYSIDPESHCVVLVQFDNEKLLNFVIVPGDSISAITIVDKKKIDSGIENIKNAVEAEQILKQFNSSNEFNKQDKKAISDEKINKTYENIISILKKRQVAFKEEIDITEKNNKIIVIGAVRICYPYQENNISSTNQVAIKKIIALLKPSFN